MRLDSVCPGGGNRMPRMKYPKGIYPPVTRFEELTTYCAVMVADLVVREVEVYLRQSLPPSFAEEIAVRAERILAARRETLRRFRNWHTLKAFMRHWLASLLAVRKPALYRALPDDFKIGRPLPFQPEPPAPALEQRAPRRFATAILFTEGSCSSRNYFYSLTLCIIES